MLPGYRRSFRRFSGWSACLSSHVPRTDLRDPLRRHHPAAMRHAGTAAAHHGRPHPSHLALKSPVLERLQDWFQVFVQKVVRRVGSEVMSFFAALLESF